MSLKDACYPLIAEHLLESDEPSKLTNMCPEEFDNVFYSPILREHASEEQKLSVIFKCLDVPKCSREVIESYLDDVGFSSLSEEFLVDFICENPILVENKGLRLDYLFTSKFFIILADNCFSTKPNAIITFELKIASKKSVWAPFFFKNLNS